MNNDAENNHAVVFSYLILNHHVPVLVHLLHCAIDVNGVDVAAKLLQDAVHGDVDSSTTHSATAKEF